MLFLLIPRGLINMHRSSDAIIAMCYPAEMGDLLVFRPMGREIVQVAAMMREICAQSAPVGVVEAAAARRFSAVSYMPATAMLG